MSGMYFEEFFVGQKLTTEKRTVTEDDIMTFARLTGLGRGESEAGLRRHLGVCFDACHMAVEFEEAAAGERRRQRPPRGVPRRFAR